ncbi:alpha/beta hydrolase family protein [Ekhidna sp.]
MKLFLHLLLPAITISVLTAQLKPRPQEPEKPYPYLSENVSFHNSEAGITLSGTLTLPVNEESFPVAILISGSSPHNRNEEIAGHKPFLVIADHLTRNGIGVLRYDDRGVGQSEGEYEIAGYADRASDVKSAVAFLKTYKRINPNKIGLIGHSEGGLIAPLVASNSTDISFIIMLAAPALPGSDIMLLQTEFSNKAQGLSDAKTQVELAFLKTIFDDVSQSTDLKKTKSSLSEKLKANKEALPEDISADNLDGILETFTAPWFQKIITYDPRTTLMEVKCPVLALNGSKDLQIPFEANLSAIEKALKDGGNSNATVKKLEGLNHLFQEAQTGMADEFATIDQTFSPLALKEMTTWVHSNILFKK